jgi:hypothetical protein
MSALFGWPAPENLDEQMFAHPRLSAIAEVAVTKSEGARLRNAVSKLLP